MKYYIALLLLFFSWSLVAQTEVDTRQWNNELSTDVSAVMSNNFRIDYNCRGNKKGAFVVGLRSRSEPSSILIDTSQLIRYSDQFLRTAQAWRFLDLSVGVKSYLNNAQQRGLWVQVTGLVSLLQWQTETFKEAREEAFYSGEYDKPKTTFGLEGNIGYRYVLSNNLSLNAHISVRALRVQSEFQTERSTPTPREFSGGEFSLGGSFLTLGYVW